MNPINIDLIIKKKNLNQRQKEFVLNLIKKGNSFTNADLARIWGTKTFPKGFKEKLLEEPKILQLIPGKPQKYRIVTEKDLSQQQITIDSSISNHTSLSQSIALPLSIDERITKLEDRFNKLEKQFQNLIPPHEKISLDNFKKKLYNIYHYLNPSNDISGIDYDVLKRRICRDLTISSNYFEDLIYDLQKREQSVNFQYGREKKYIHIKMR